MRRAAVLFLVIVSIVAFPAAQTPVEKLDYATIGKIRDEGLNRSQVMDHIGWLADVYGPRLTGGPGIMQAGDWALKKFAEWGLANPHRETFPFGRGWSLERFSAHMIEPQVQPLIGLPASWTPGTPGIVSADVVRAQIETEADFERYRGKLAGKIVLTQPARAVSMLEGLIVHRMTPEQFSEAATTPIPSARGRGGRGGRGGAADNLRRKIAQFYKSEGVVALLNRGSDNETAAAGSGLDTQQRRPDGGTIFPSGGGSRESNPAEGVPTVTLAVEHYNRMTRILDKGIAVKVELNIQAKFHDETTPNGFNLVAEIPGSDPALKDEDPQDDWRQAAPHDSDCPLGWGRRRAARIAGVRPRALRRHHDDDAQARAREGCGVLQLRQRERPGARHLAAEQSRRRADFPAVDRAAARPRGLGNRPAIGHVHRPRVVRQRRPAGVPVHGRPAGVQLAHPPLEHGHGRSRAAGRHGAARHRDRGVRVECREPRREAAAESAAAAAATHHQYGRPIARSAIHDGHWPRPPAQEDQEK
jgi:hypothetical protein